MNDQQLKDAEALFKQCMENMDGLNKENPNLENPFLLACNQMFKDFEKETQNVKDAQGQTSSDGKAAGGDDETFMNLLQGFAKDLMSADPQKSDTAMDKIMGEFTNFLSETENNEEMKSALDEVVKQIVSKDSLYEPMKQLKEAYPKWLEENWQKCSEEEIERYNKQLDMIIEICTLYDSSTDNNDKVFEKLGKLQELGQPPMELMQKL